MAIRINTARRALNRAAVVATSSRIALASSRPSALTVRRFASESGSGEAKSGSNTWLWASVLGLAAASGYYYYSTQDTANVKASVKKPLDYNAVYKRIAAVLDASDYDDGSYGPVLVRLAWHASGTFDKKVGNGGSNGATMRFGPEANDGANAGLQIARDLLEPIKKEFPEISYADLWTLAGVVAIQEMGGPVIPWRPGRADAVSVAAVPPQGRLPDASKEQSHIRDVFYRMGFNDQEIVALVGAHALGRCHTDRSGFEGPWTFAPTTFSNQYFVKLVQEKWVEKKWSGPKQYIDKATGSLMMLPADLALIKDRGFKKFVDLYAKDQDKFFADFSSAFSKLLELGVPFKEDAPVYKFETA